MPRTLNQIYTRASKAPRPAVSGSLVTLTDLVNRDVTALLSNQPPLKHAIIINFPAMPDSIDLVRRASYVTRSLFTSPDGALAWYQYTDPLQIPFSFKLHAFDHEYCPDGALTLLDVAAKLQALVLPIGQAKTEVNKVTVKESSTGEPNLERGSVDVSDDVESRKFQFSYDGGNTYPPPTVFLDLIYVGSDMPGISCVGYITDVTTKLHGPWLSGEDYYNLPTMLEASFTFVHRPCHSNTWSNQVTVSAMADDVKNQLFNTYKLVNKASYKGFLT
jgi:hypothetical protein